MMRRAAYLAVIVVAGCSGSNSSGAEPEPSPSMQSVRVAVATLGTLHPALTIPGTIAPAQTVALSNAIAEPTLAVYVQEGDRVTRGQTLAQLDVDDLEANLEAARRTARADQARTSESAYNAQLTYEQSPTQVAQARATVQQAHQTILEALHNLQRDRQLGREGYIPQQNIDEQVVVVQNDRQAETSARAQLQSAVASQQVNGSPESGLGASTVAAAREDAQAQAATAEQLRRQIERARIVSPIDGVVVNRNLNPGEYPSGRQIFTLEGNDTMFAILTASSTQAYAVAPGNAVTLLAAGSRGRPIEGKVVAVLDAATPGSTNFTVKVAVPNPRHDLRAGTPIQAGIALHPVRGILIPSSAFVDDARTRVIAVRDDTARTVRVSEISTDGANSVVTGLQAGDRVVRDGDAGVDNGERVAIAR